MSLVPFLFAVALSALVLGGCSEPPQPTISLYRAIHIGDLDQIKRHIHWGTDINQPAPRGESPLHLAVRRGRLIIARVLLEHGADPNARNQAGESPLQIALSEGKTQLADILLEEGAMDDLQALLVVLVRAGVDDRDSLGLLAGRGAKVDATDQSGMTPLHIAVDAGRSLQVKRLIDLGADLDIPDGAGRTPLFIATEKGNQDIMALLQRFGARAEPAGRTQ